MIRGQAQAYAAIRPAGSHCQTDGGYAFKDNLERARHIEGIALLRTAAQIA
jgi:hypothetical protein